MKLISAERITIDREDKYKSARRVDFMNPLTGEIPKWCGDGPLEEEIVRMHYGFTETITCKFATTDEVDPRFLTYDGHEFFVTSFSRNESGIYTKITARRGL